MSKGNWQSTKKRAGRCWLLDRNVGNWRGILTQRRPSNIQHRMNESTNKLSFITTSPPWYLDKASKQTPSYKHPDFFKDWSPTNLLQFKCDNNAKLDFSFCLKRKPDHTSACPKSFLIMTRHDCLAEAMFLLFSVTLGKSLAQWDFLIFLQNTRTIDHCIIF